MDRAPDGVGRPDAGPTPRRWYGSRAGHPRPAGQVEVCGDVG